LTTFVAAGLLTWQQNRMALLPLFLDMSGKRLVNKRTDAGIYVLPDFFTEDTLDIELTLFQRISWTTAPYFDYVDISNYALFISVGSAGSVLASQGIWTKNTENTIFSGTLSLNTTGINGLSGSPTNKIFEIRLFDGTNYNRAQFNCVIRKSVALEAAVTLPGTDTALGAIEASEIYIPYKLPPGRSITLVSADETKETMLYLDNDGTVRWVNLT
jgi:hypothetical protein